MSATTTLALRILIISPSPSSSESINLSRVPSSSMSSSSSDLITSFMWRIIHFARSQSSFRNRPASARSVLSSRPGYVDIVGSRVASAEGHFRHSGISIEYPSEDSSK
ncbi:hypothetical protein B0H66DRAFT_595150 [Apodospora peruviana]|uniref:Uncharacterized protein n=1 Tax=Apodospora peruviana TaxID=516989 RepID=A0AAE0HTV1_9PEZI|nr:hypothetical protein B0H66DRAFT_595150 [Apodospora peruviana]